MRERLLDDLARDDVPRERDELLAGLPREDVLRDRDDEAFDDDAFDDDRVDDELRREDERRAVRRSAAGISSWATAFVSCGISFSRNFAIRSSSRRMLRASFAVSLSPTASASDSRPVY